MTEHPAWREYDAWRECSPWEDDAEPYAPDDTPVSTEPAVLDDGQSECIESLRSQS